MTERAQPGGTLPHACPFLALEEDRDRRSAVPDGRHRCYAEASPQPRALTYQESFCLSPAFPACRSFLDWAARAAAEPVEGQARPGNPGGQPLAPIPAPATAAPPLSARPPLNPVLPPPSGLPPAPASYVPPPAWQPPGPAAWAQPGPAATDPAASSWAVRPPWVAQPELRTTASSPSSAQPSPDAAHLGWTTSGSATRPRLDESDDAFPEWRPAPRPGEVQGTFGSRRAAERPTPLVPIPTESGPMAAAPPMAALAASDLADAPPQAPVMAPPAPTPGPAVQAGEGTPLVDPVAIPVERAALDVAVAWSGVMGEAGRPPGSTSADATVPTPTEGVPPATAPMSAPSAPDGPSPATAPAPATPGRRSPASRWLPSFLSRDPLPVDATGGGSAAARPGTASRASTGVIDPDQPGGAAVEAQPATDAQPGGAHPAGAGEPASAGEAELAATAVATATRPLPDAAVDDDDPPGALAPRVARRQGAPVDTEAHAAAGPQARQAPRTRGSGEWIKPKAQATRTGWRRILPGVVPPVAIGGLVLFLAALALFLLPGFLAGGGGSPDPTSPLDEAGVLASDRPGASTDLQPSAEPEGEFQSYTVRRGDTLMDIARQHSVTIDQLVCANRELRRNPNLLSVGQELRIPPQDYECPARNANRNP